MMKEVEAQIIPWSLSLRVMDSQHLITFKFEMGIYRTTFLLTLANSASNRTSSDHTSMDGLEAGPDLWRVLSTSLLYSSESNIGSKAAKR